MTYGLSKSIYMTAVASVWETNIFIPEIYIKPASQPSMWLKHMLQKMKWKFTYDILYGGKEHKFVLNKSSLIYKKESINPQTVQELWRAKAIYNVSYLISYWRRRRAGSGREVLETKFYGWLDSAENLEVSK